MESVSLKYNNAGVKTGPSLQFLPEPEIFDKGRQDVKCKIFTARHGATNRRGGGGGKKLRGEWSYWGTSLCCTAHTSSFKIILFVCGSRGKKQVTPRPNLVRCLVQTVSTLTVGVLVVAALVLVGPGPSLRRYEDRIIMIGPGRETKDKSSLVNN